MLFSGCRLPVAGCRLPQNNYLSQKKIRMGNDLIFRTGDFIFNKVRKYELVILAIVILAFGLWLYNIPHTLMITYILLSSVGCIYFFSAFGSPDDMELKGIDNFFLKAAGFASAVAVAGISYKIERWPSATLVLTVGIVAMLLSLFYIVYHRLRNPGKGTFSMAFIIRLIFISNLSGWLLFSLR
jgi:hypothetical protein